MLGIIDSTRFEDFHNGRCDRKSGSIDYHSRPTGRSVTNYYMYYTPWRTEKVDGHTARNRARTTCVVSQDLQTDWINDDPDIQRTPRDSGRHYDAYK